MKTIDILTLERQKTKLGGVVQDHIDESKGVFLKIENIDRNISRKRHGGMAAGCGYERDRCDRAIAYFIDTQLRYNSQVDKINALKNGTGQRDLQNLEELNDKLRVQIGQYRQKIAEAEMVRNAWRDTPQKAFEMEGLNGIFSMFECDSVRKEKEGFENAVIPYKEMLDKAQTFYRVLSEREKQIPLTIQANEQLYRELDALKEKKRALDDEIEQMKNTYFVAKEAERVGLEQTKAIEKAKEAERGKIKGEEKNKNMLFLGLIAVGALYFIYFSRGKKAVKVSV